MAPADLPAAALEFVNYLSEIDVDVDYVALRFDALTKELGLTYSEPLRQQLGLAQNHYTLVSQQQSTDTAPVPSLESAAFNFYFDIYSTNLQPPALSLANAYAKVLGILLAEPADYVVIWCADASLVEFYNKVGAAGADYPPFLNTAKQLSVSFGEPQTTETPTQLIIKSADRMNALSEWADRHDLVYSAVLVLRYPVGQIPEKYQL